MGRNIRVVGVRRKEIDVDRLAIAFLMMGRAMHEQRLREAAEADKARGDAPALPSDNDDERRT